MNKNLEVHEFSLKRIVESLKDIPRDGRFGDKKPQLSAQQKKELMELVGKYNEYGKSLSCGEAIREVAETLAKISEMAEAYAAGDVSDWFQGRIVERDFKQSKRISGDFQKLAKECYGKLQELTALYEDYGRVLERYFEIQNMDEAIGVTPNAIPSSPATVEEPTKTFQPPVA